jgi:cytochrome c oxidase subunit III
MATTIHPPASRVAREPKNTSGNGGWRNLVPAGDNPPALQEYAPPPASTGIWVFVAAVCMTFAALTSALVVRKGGAVDWRHFTLPYILYLNTAVLLASSVTLEIARRQVAAFMGGVNTAAANPSRWLYATLALGFLFLAGQYLAWRELSARGLYLATNPSSSFFYVFTALHAVHLLGGLYAMTRVIRKLDQHVLRRVTLDATAHYWHFMDVLWIYLLALLWMKL